MWTEGWRCPEANHSSAAASRPRQVSWHQFKIETEDEGRIERIERIFQTSADCCADFGDRETDLSQPLVAEAIGTGPQRRWSLVTGISGESGQKKLRERFEQVVREALAELGYQFCDPQEAIDAWLDFLLKVSTHSWGMAIAELGAASNTNSRN
jgi:hypothetical protein